jgi:hypothetical protein
MMLGHRRRFTDRVTDPHLGETPQFAIWPATTQSRRAAPPSAKTWIAVTLPPGRRSRTRTTPENMRT